MMVYKIEFKIKIGSEGAKVTGKEMKNEDLERKKSKWKRKKRKMHQKTG